MKLVKNDSDRVIDLLIYKNQYALIKKLNVFFGDHNKKFICKRYSNSQTIENMLHEPKCETIDQTNIKISPEPHIHWKKDFQKNPSFFRIYADFEADNEKNFSSSGNKTTNIYR